MKLLQSKTYPATHSDPGLEGRRQENESLAVNNNSLELLGLANMARKHEIALDNLRCFVSELHQRACAALQGAWALLKPWVPKSLPQQKTGGTPNIKSMLAPRPQAMVPYLLTKLSEGCAGFLS